MRNSTMSLSDSEEDRRAPDLAALPRVRERMEITWRPIRQAHNQTGRSHAVAESGGSGRASEGLGNSTRACRGQDSASQVAFRVHHWRTRHF